MNVGLIEILMFELSWQATFLMLRSSPSTPFQKCISNYSIAYRVPSMGRLCGKSDQVCVGTWFRLTYYTVSDHEKADATVHHLRE